MSDSFDESDELTQEELEGFAKDHGLVSRKSVDLFFSDATKVLQDALEAGRTYNENEPLEKQVARRLGRDTSHLYQKDHAGREVRYPGATKYMAEEQEEKEKPNIPIKENLRETLNAYLKSKGYYDKKESEK